MWRKTRKEEEEILGRQKREIKERDEREKAE